jgi:transcriptional regulator of acetoin/glycerol metabolism
MCAITAESLSSLPKPLEDLVAGIVEVPPLRERPDDIILLARYAAYRARGYEVDISAAAQNALVSCGWPGNVDQLFDVVRRAALRATGAIDVRHLPPSVLTGAPHRLTRIESFERDEIVRCLSRPSASVTDAARELGMSRATVYRKIAQYDLRLWRN